jgi:hypothetical protein
MNITQDQPVVDCDRLGDGTSYTDELNESLIRWTGLEQLDLSDAKPGAAALSPENSPDLLGLTRQDLQTVHRTAIRVVAQAWRGHAEDRRALEIIESKLQVVLSL